MRSRKPSREEAKPRRPKSRLGPIPTLGELAGQAAWVHVYCEATGCHHSAPLKLAGVIERYGEGTSSDVLRQRARCSICGTIGATIRLPSWVDSATGTAPFPASKPE